ILWNPHSLVVRSQVACDRSGAGRLGAHGAYATHVVSAHAGLEAFRAAHRVRPHRSPRASIGLGRAIEQLEGGAHGSGPRRSVALSGEGNVGGSAEYSDRDRRPDFGILGVNIVDELEADAGVDLAQPADPQIGGRILIGA